MVANRGKDFERELSKQFTSTGLCFDRIKDDMSGFKGSSNISDFNVFFEGKLFYIECKAVHGKTFNYSLLRDSQYFGLLQKTKFPNVFAGVLIWFVDLDITVYVPIHVVKDHKELNQKSFKADNIPSVCTRWVGTKRRVFIDYEILQNFNNIINKRKKYGY